jgi:hypothetical protein
MEQMLIPMRQAPAQGNPRDIKILADPNFEPQLPADGVALGVSAMVTSFLVSQIATRIELSKIQSAEKYVEGRP